MFRKIANLMCKKIKGSEFVVDPDLPITYLLRYCFDRFYMLISGLYRFRSLVFCGANVRVKSKRMLFLGRGITLGESVYLDCLSTEGVHIGDGVSIGPYSRVECTGTIRNVGSGFKIGEGSGIGAFSFIGAAGGVRIGCNVIMGQRISFHSENHIFDSLDTLIKDQGVIRKSINIHDDCWVGANVTFLAGSRVGSGSIVAAGAVVNGVYPEHSIIAGVPAKVIASRLRASI